jgi:tetratricopeptide (TPR) repeat protein
VAGRALRFRSNLWYALPMLIAGIVGAVLLAQAAAAQPARSRGHGRPRTVLVVPFALRGETPEWVGLGVAELITDAVVQQDRENFITSGQLDMVLRRRDLRLVDASVPGAALELGRALGATDVVAGAVQKAGPSVSIEARHLRGRDGRAVRTARAEGPAEELPRLAHEVAVELLGTPPAQPPMTADSAALEQVVRCELELVRQPLGPRARPILNNERLYAADESCGAALEADPGLGLGHAGLAVALAAGDELVEAEAEARRAQEGRFVPLAVLAEAWIARRRGDAARATAVLKAACSRHPGFLHALGYLGVERSEAGDEAAALAAFSRYLARSPNHPWAMARKARALSRLGKRGAAVALTRAALERNPGDPEIRIELASRYLEQGKDALAEEQLRLALAARPVRPLAALRLGALYLKERRLGEARAALQQALREARREDEGPTRAAAHAELARLSALSGDADEAVAELRLARAEGLQKLPCAEPELLRLSDKPELAALCGRAEGAQVPGGDEDEDLLAIDRQ